MNKPTTASEYAPEMVDLVRKTLLYVATKLGDLMNERGYQRTRGRTSR